MTPEKDTAQAVTNAVLALKIDGLVNRVKATQDDHEARIKSLERWRWGLGGALLALLPNAIESMANLVGTP